MGDSVDDNRIAAGEERRVFHTLDGLRGVAALLVAVLHLPSFTRANLIGGTYTGLQCAFLGVDLFFVLSGFVIAYAYERRLRGGLPFAAFAGFRIERLAPLYWLGVVLAMAQMTAGHLLLHSVWTPKVVGLVGLGALAMIPVPMFGFSQVMYLLNPATWTLAAELIVNAVYGLFARWLTTPVLIGVCLLSGLGLAGLAMTQESIDLGISWTTFPGGLLRAAYGFSAGVLMFRLHRARPASGKTSGWLWMALLAGLLLVPLQRPWVSPYALICMLGLFPALVYFAAASRVGPRGTAICTTAGTLSYALYILHTPIGRAGALVAKALHWNIANDLGAAGLLLAFIVISWVADVCYDRPVHRWLKARRRRLAAATSLPA